MEPDPRPILSLTPEGQPIVEPNMDRLVAALEVVHEGLVGKSPMLFRAALPEEMLNQLPYALRKAFYDYAAEQFAFMAMVVRVEHEVRKVTGKAL